jgi:23S rRNA (adenine2503-C2)-methyltransferase
MINNAKPFFLDLAFNDLNHELIRWGEPGYRADQVWKGIYQGLKTNPEEITNISKALRQRLNASFNFSHLNPHQWYKSSDEQTRKILFQLPDNLAIETVLMRYDRRRTLCVSSQAGCALGCVFCATGQMGFKRHLSSGEIVEQVLFFSRLLNESGEKLTNIVVMGMGEPFHNYDNTMAAIDQLNHPKGLNLGARRFTISTVGLVPEILRFANEQRQINLAVSLHAAEDELRSSILPINKKYPLEQLIAACHVYFEKTKRRITFEWALIAGVNDGSADARKLAELVKDFPCHVNIIPLNPTKNYAGRGTTVKQAGDFKEVLENRGIPCTIRVRRGIDIQAGCGQLATKVL